jgi:predicted RNA-binding protein associated with RNAse of E/G family
MPFMNITVQKKNPAGEVMTQYDGVILRREANSVTLEAGFTRDDMPFMGVILKKNDRFVETFYTDKWFNIFEIHDRDDDHFKGYYCNVATPAVVEDGVISFVDLALDLWVSVDGEQTVLDEDEFEELKPDPHVREQALAALEELKERFKTNNPPK